MFLIINGQHSVTASKQLQLTVVYEARKIELQMWKAYIVWSLKKNQLLCISKWYNACNHLKHSQLTQESNILSQRSIWLSYGRPTSIKLGVGRDPNNNVVFNVAKLAVSISSLFIIKFQQHVKQNRTIFACIKKNLKCQKTTCWYHFACTKETLMCIKNSKENIEIQNSSAF